MCGLVLVLPLLYGTARLITGFFRLGGAVGGSMEGGARYVVDTSDSMEGGVSYTTDTSDSMRGGVSYVTNSSSSMQGGASYT